MKAIVLAAGHGTRMEPLTRQRAKPALPVLDEPLVLGHARRLAEQGVRELVVNLHAHPETLIDALREAPLPVRFSREAVEPLGSGGGILAARGALDGAQPFLVVNGDMRCDLDLAALLEAHRRCGGPVTLALRDDPRNGEFGTIGYDENSRVRRVARRLDLGGETGSALFTGVQMMEPAIFDLMPDRKRFEIFPDVYLPALKSGVPLGTWLQPAGSGWWPVGTPGELLDANLEALDGLGAGAPHLDPSAEVAGELTPPVWIGAGARIESGARVGPRSVVGRGARVARGSRLSESLVLPGAEPPAGTAGTRLIADAGEVWRVD